MGIVSSSLGQTLTYWAPGAKDLYGKPSFSTPVQLPCRWEDKNESVINKTGEQIVSKSRVFLLNQDLDIDGYVLLGVSAAADPSILDDAREIQQIGKTPDLRNLKSLNTLYL